MQEMHILYVYAYYIMSSLRFVKVRIEDINT